MKLDEIKGQLINKHRSVRDLMRFIQTRTDNNSNYTLLLGAGCSISSGVRAATTLCDLWRSEIVQDKYPDLINSTADQQRDHLKRFEGGWYNPEKEYSTLFERKYDLQRQRRMFVENEVKHASPSIGYAYLTSLVEQSYFNTIFTTNFDDLINEAFFLYSKQRPIVCAHDSSINSVTVTSKRPKVIKLHGDYLFDDIKTTDRETESLGQNMKEKFIEFAKDYGLVVVGYAGGDRSIIDVLTLLLKNDDYFRNGIYWCVRKGADISEELRRLFWKDRVFFVEIDGFDEFFAEMYSNFNEGEYLPPAASYMSDNSENLAKKLLLNENSFPITSEILKKAKESLQRQSKRKAIANSIINSESKDRPLTNSNYTDDELLTLTGLEQLFRDRKYVELVEIARRELTKGGKKELTNKIAGVLVNAYLALREEDDALKLINSLDQQEPHSARWLLTKARVLNDKTEKLNAIKAAKEKNDESSEVYKALGNWYAGALDQCSVGEKKNYIDLAVDNYKRSIELDPSKLNPAWTSLHSVLLKHEQDKLKRNEALNSIEQELAKQGTRGWMLLDLKTDRIEKTTDQREINKILSEIDRAEERIYEEDRFHYDRLRLKVFSKTANTVEVKNVLESLIPQGKHQNDADLALDIASALRKNVGDESAACDVLKSNFDQDEFDSNIFEMYIETLANINKISDAEDVLEKSKELVIRSFELKIRLKIEGMKGNYKKALSIVEQIQLIDNSPDSTTKSYLQLLDGDFEGAKKTCQTILEKNNYSSHLIAETINFEYARKKLGLKPDNNRLDNVLKNDPSPRMRSVVCALKGHKKEAMDFIKEELKYNKLFKYEVQRWPVFDELRNDQELERMIGRANGLIA